MNLVTTTTLDMHALDSIILDMDGTLLDLQFDELVWNQRLPARYAQIHHISIDEARARILDLMTPIRGTLPWYCFDNWRELTGIDLTDIENEVYEFVRPRAGAVEFLQKLRQLPAQVILATNADRRSMTRKIKHTALRSFFDHIVSSHDFGYAKEDARFWHSLHDKVSFEPSRSLFIDDNHCVLTTAENFGVRFVYGIANPASNGETKSSERFHCLDTFSEFTF